jgi:protein gp37
MNKTKINWCDMTWNPIVGCNKIAQGCRNCYAEQLHTMRHKAYLEGKKLPVQYAKPFSAIQFFPERLNDPKLRSKKPLRIFVNSMSDLFHEDIPFELIDSVYEVMGFHKQHTFLVLTKRIQRALEYYKWTSIFAAFGKMQNIELGVSVEDQKAADERIPILLKTPAAHRFISCEPLLGKIDLSPWINPKSFSKAINDDKIGKATNKTIYTRMGNNIIPVKLDWVIVGHESGKNRRQGTTDDVRAIVNDCKGNNIPVWVKQLQLCLDNKITDNIEDFPENLRIRELPKC